MRLTLRTLLAYLDDILEPQDTEDLRKKIDESKFATELVQRTRDCIRRLRLPAPPLNGRGLAGDANTVAEYLDNTLPSERVADFEKICLESDAHLAEVAACHQILTLVLGEPADVDPAARDRIYGVIDQAEAQDGAPAAASTAPPVGSVTIPPPINAINAAVDTPVVRRAKPEVPEYLRDSRSRFWPVAVVLLIAAFLTSGILLLTAPPEWREMASNWFTKGHSDQSGEAPATDGVHPTKADSASDSSTQAPKPDSADDKSPSATGPGTEPAAVDLEPAPSGPPAVRLPKLAQDNDADNPLAPEPSEGPLPTVAKPRMPLDDTADARIGPVEPAPAKPASPEPPGTAPLPALEGTPPAVPPAALPPIDRAEVAGDGIGRYLSGQDVLLKFDPGTSSWRRLPGKAALLASDRLLSLPSFRPSITLITGISVQAAGPADFGLIGLDAQGIPGISVDFGRLVLVTIGRAGNQVRLRLGDRSGLATFVDVESALAVEVRHVLVAGKDPETEPGILAVDLYAASGNIRWEEDGQAVTFAAPTGRSLSPPPIAEIDGADQPKWITTDGLTTLDQRAAASLEHDITLDRPVSLSLKELAENRRAEVRTLAVRCSAYVGQFEPFVAALNDADQRTEWPRHIEALKTAMARSPQTAERVRLAFEKHRGAEAQELYRMLWGYSSNEFKDGAAAKLVEYLNHDSLDYRVLAFWNLQNITGFSFFYRPESPVAKRRPQYLKWKERLKEGKVVPAAAATTKAGAASRTIRPAAGETEE